jgi:hypothetical protein
MIINEKYCKLIPFGVVVVHFNDGDALNVEPFVA